MPVPWSGDGSLEDQWRIERNIAALVVDLVSAAPRRAAPSIALALGWHRRIFEGIKPPVPYYVGGIRDSNPDEPELVGHEVAVPGPVAAIQCVAADRVPDELRAFEGRIRGEVEALDRAIPIGSQLLLEKGDEVLRLAALAHGEWIRIHPFVNGNGRVARVWANWCAARYGLPAFVRVRPRPQGDAYVAAASRSMVGDHALMEIQFRQMLLERLIKRRSS